LLFLHIQDKTEVLEKIEEHYYTLLNFLTKCVLVILFLYCLLVVGTLYYA
jgi:hypothetical protein